MKRAIENQKVMNPFIVGGFVVAVAVIVLLAVTLANLMRTNPYGEETRIDNLSEYYDNLAQNEKDLIYHEIYNMLYVNLEAGTEIPREGAFVREGTAEYDYDKTLGVYYGKFIVDVPAVEWSFSVQFEWSPKANNQELGGYPVMVSCVKKSLRIYENNVTCVDVESNYVSWENEYQLDYSFGNKTSYNIRKVLGEYWLDSVGLDDYNAVVQETSLKRLKAQPDITYDFDVALDDVLYHIVARTDVAYGERYIATLVKGGGKEAGFIVTNDEEMISDLTNWLVEMNAGAIDVTVEALE